MISYQLNFGFCLKQIMFLIKKSVIKEIRVIIRFVENYHWNLKRTKEGYFGLGGAKFNKLI